MSHNHAKPMAKITITMKMAYSIIGAGPELMFTDQDCFRISLGLDLHQELLAFHDLDRQLEINQPSLQEGQRQHVLRVDIMGVVAGMAPHVELKKRPAPRVTLRADIDFFQQVISLSERTTRGVEPILPVTPLDGLVEISRFYAVRGTNLLNILVGPVRDALAVKEFSPRRRGWRNAPRAERKLIAHVRNFMPIHGLDHLRRRRQQGLARPVNEGAGILHERRRQHGTGTDQKSTSRLQHKKSSKIAHTHLEGWRPTVAHAGHIVVPPLPV